MKRRMIQWLSLIASNAYIPGFLRGNIYKGPLKQFCVPGLNCYSCPGAFASCPLGSLQAVMGSIKYRFSYYVTGLLLLFGLTLGRFICGFLCPFGLVQELLHKLPTPKIKRPWGWPRYIKYALLLVFVIALPLLAVNPLGMGDPAFCKYICPAGTLEAGLPLVALNPPLRAALGALFAWKLALALVIVAGCLTVYRFFCRYLCPLGAIYGLFNPISLYQLRCHKARCTDCGLCRDACRLGVDPARKNTSGECIRCGDCATACPHKALSLGFKKQPE
ncbi:MAG: 4Fe-4S binding protein [Clostridiales bacterium]|nr:4Fe-4S binding protein [Clostridiales bacterium]